MPKHKRKYKLVVLKSTEDSCVSDSGEQCFAFALGWKDMCNILKCTRLAREEGTGAVFILKEIKDAGI